MKQWYIINGEYEDACDIVSISVLANNLTLDYHCIAVKIKFADFKRDYALAKGGTVVTAYAMSQINTKAGKPIKIIFK